MASKRRYKIGIHSAYDDVFDQTRIISDILNSGNKPPDAYTTLWDMKNMECVVLELEGSPADEGKLLKGEYFRNKSKMLAVIPSLRLQLIAVDEKFASLQKQRADEGFEPMEQMPVELEYEKLRDEARLDVRTEELEFIKQRIESYVEVEDTALTDMILAYGLKQRGKLEGGILVMIDGQRVTRTVEGILIINEPKSKYHGMAVSDYRQLANKWKAALRDVYYLKQKQYEKDIADGKLVTMPVISTNKVDRSSLPGWPADVKNYLEKKHEKVK